MAEMGLPKTEHWAEKGNSSVDSITPRISAHKIITKPHKNQIKS